MTSPGAVVGTLACMAPEQLRGEPADARSDIWSLGIVLYEMASGVRPFQGKTTYELSSSILHESPLPLPERAGDKTLTALRTVVERCLDKDPELRYQTSSEVGVALEAVQRGSASRAWLVWKRVLSRRRWPAVAAALAIALALVAALDIGNMRSRLAGRAPRPKYRSLAVLPLANLTGDPEQQYFVDGITDTLINGVAQIGSLKVISRTSVMRYKETSKPLREIAAELNVDAILEGSTPNPLGIDVEKPRLSWVMEEKGQKAEDRGQRQTAYQILVASSEEAMKQDKGDLWDSGKVSSDRSLHVAYAGKPIESRLRCWWKVRVWDQDDKASRWSQPAHWSMGLLQPGDWAAKWIGVRRPAPAPAGRSPLGPGPLRIVSASYQSVSGASTRNGTELLALRVQDSTLLIVAGNAELGGDPAYGIEKKLVVEYELAGRRGTMTVAENERRAINLDIYSEEEAKWSRPGYLRKGFMLDSAVRRATVYATALGLYELRLNGQRVGDHLLAPEWTDYHRRVQYQTYDVTPLLRSGANAIGATLGNGWYCGGWRHWEKRIRAMYGSEPSFLVQMEIEFADGRRQTVVSDDSWRGMTDGPHLWPGRRVQDRGLGAGLLAQR